MRESSTLADNVTRHLQVRGVLLNTKGQYMKESNSLADNVTIKQLQSPFLLDTKGQYIKESNSLADNATIKQLQSSILLDTKGQYIKESSVPQRLRSCRNKTGRHKFPTSVSSTITHLDFCYLQRILKII